MKMKITVSGNVDLCLETNIAVRVIGIGQTSEVCGVLLAVELELTSGMRSGVITGIGFRVFHRSGMTPGSSGSATQISS